MMLREASIIVSFALILFPPLLLRYLPYRGCLRVKPWQVVAMNAVLFLAQILLYFWWSRRVQPSFHTLQIFKLVCSFLFSAIPYFVIRERISKLVFVRCITAAYITILSRLALFWDIHSFGGNAFSLHYGTHNTILSCLLLVTWPLLALFLTRAIVPSLRAASRSVTRFLWAMPMLFFANYIIYVTDLREEQMSSARYLLLILPLAAGIGVSCYTLLRMLRQATESARLSAEVAFMSRLVRMQREQYQRMVENEEKSKAVRHDLRHHLAVIKQYVHRRETDDALHYCDELAGAILSTEERVLCGNFAVNAVAAHYLSVAEAEGIPAEIHLDIPKETGPVSASDLCIIVGNLLENALEACRRVPAEERFLRLHSRVQHSQLFITMENRFDGAFRRKNNRFFSSKRIGAGIGLSSIGAVCQKYNGTSKFSSEGNIFLSSVMVNFQAE